MKEAVIVSAVRTAVGRAPRGSLRNTRPDDMETAISQLRDSGHAFVGTLYERGKKDA